MQQFIFVMEQNLQRAKTAYYWEKMYLLKLNTKKLHVI